eukprot:672319-Rhodomonas_salina.1
MRFSPPSFNEANIHHHKQPHPRCNTIEQYFAAVALLILSPPSVHGMASSACTKHEEDWVLLSDSGLVLGPWQGWSVIARRWLILTRYVRVKAA